MHLTGADGGRRGAGRAVAIACQEQPGDPQRECSVARSEHAAYAACIAASR